MPRSSARRRRRPRSFGRTRFLRKAAALRSRRARKYFRRPATRRRILNVASIKKHDNMLPYVVTPGGVPTAGPIQTGTGFASLFMPSARKLGYDSAGESTRGRQVTFSVGYKERVEVNILGGGVWKWRRVVFTAKGRMLYDDVTWTDPYHDKTPDIKGCDMVRLIAQPTSDQHQEIRRILWDGTQGVDWSSEFTAKVDTSRVTPLYDRTFTFNPRNESGFSQTFRFWHRTGKSIVYDEDESGGHPDSGGSYVSVKGKPGMGDLYVYDIVYLAVPASTGNASMQWSPEGTYYWHER